MKLFSGHDLDFNAYQLGQIAAHNNEIGNPFDRETGEWYSWNKGWNEYVDDEDDDPEREP